MYYTLYLFKLKSQLKTYCTEQDIYIHREYRKLALDRAQLSHTTILTGRARVGVDKQQTELQGLKGS